MQCELHTGQIGESSEWFALEQKSKLQEPNLFRLSLSLKFKLSAELLLALSSGGDDGITSNTSGANGSSGGGGYKVSYLTNQRNQSSGKNLVERQTGAQLSPQHLHSRQQRLQQQQRTGLDFKIKLQCKYKLTEVSEVSYNELVVRQMEASRPILMPVESNGGRAKRKLTTERTQTFDRRQPAQRWTKSASESLVRVGKLAGNQVTQSKCPAGSGQLRRAVYNQTLAANACRLGSLALLPDDPVLVAAETTELPQDNLDEDEEAAALAADEQDGETSEERKLLKVTSVQASSSSDSSAASQQELNLSVGDSISVNCSTISALSSSAAATFQAADSAQQQQDYNQPDESEYWPSTSVGAFCNNQKERSRSVISGKYHTNEEQDQNQRSFSASASNRQPVLVGQSTASHHKQHQLKHVAYLSLQTDKLWIGGGQALGASATQLAGLVAPHQSFSPTKQATNAESAEQNYNHQSLAPPLLEWFINNQEVSCVV